MDPFEDDSMNMEDIALSDDDNDADDDLPGQQLRKFVNFSNVFKLLLFKKNLISFSFYRVTKLFSMVKSLDL